MQVSAKHPDIKKLAEPAGDCVWCFQPLSGPHKKATHRVWSVEWSQFMNCCARHAIAIQECNDNHRKVTA